MKRLLAISAITAGIGCALISHHVGAQNPPKAFSADSVAESDRPPVARAETDGKTTVDQARAEYLQAEENIAIFKDVGLSTSTTATRSGSSTTGGRSTSSTPIGRSKLRPLVVESFVARQRLQRAELGELRRQFAEIERAIEDREQHMDAIVNSRVNELLAGRTGQAVTAVHSRVAGTVAWIAQVTEAAAIDNDSIRSRHRQISVGDKVKAGDLLLTINSTEAGDNKAVDIVQILAPIAGVIVEKNVNAGDIVMPNDTLFQISSAILGPGSGGGGRTEYVQVQRDGKAVIIPRPTGPSTSVGEGPATPGFQTPPARANVSSEPSVPPQPQQAPDNTEPNSDDRNAASVDGAFDIDTRERLARLDLKEAEYEYASAEAALAQAVYLYKQGAATQAERSSREENHRRAANAVERAKIKLDGITQQRTELKAAAETAVAEANAEIGKATAQVRIAEANVAKALAEQKQLEADISSADATCKRYKKEYERMKILADADSIDARLLDEVEEKRSGAKAAFDRACAAADAGRANVEHAKAELRQAEAESALAEQRLLAAKARRDRLLSHAPHPKEE